MLGQLRANCAHTTNDAVKPSLRRTVWIELRCLRILLRLVLLILILLALRVIIRLILALVLYLRLPVVFCCVCGLPITVLFQNNALEIILWQHPPPPDAAENTGLPYSHDCARSSLSS